MKKASILSISIFFEEMQFVNLGYVGGGKEKRTDEKEVNSSENKGK